MSIRSYLYQHTYESRSAIHVPQAAVAGSALAVIIRLFINQPSYKTHKKTYCLAHKQTL